MGYEYEDDEIKVSGDWTTSRRTLWDVAKCVLGRHKAYTKVRTLGMYFERCSCGAFRDYFAWFYMTPKEARGKWKMRR